MKQDNILKSGIVFLITVVLYVVMQIGAAFVLPKSFMEGAGYYIIVIAFEIIWFGVPALIYLLTRKPRVRILGRRVSVEQLVLAFIIGVLTYYVSNFIQILWQLLLRLLGYTPMVPSLPMLESAGGFAVMAFAIAVIPAFFEELMFRGLLFNSLGKEKRLTGAILISSALFMLMHGTIESLPYTFLAGVLLAYLAYRSSSLWPGIVMHFSFNLTSVALLLLTRTSDFFTQQPLPDLTDTNVYIMSLLVTIPVATVAAGLCFLMLFLFNKVSRPVVPVELQPSNLPWIVKWLPILAAVFLLIVFIFITFFATLLMGGL